MFDRFLEMFQNISLSGVIIVVLVIVAIILVAVLIARSRARKAQRPGTGKRHAEAVPVKANIRTQAVSASRVSKVASPPVSAKDDKWANAPLYVSDKDRKARGEVVEPEEAAETEVAGEFPAYIVRMDDSLDYNVIPEPMGDVFMAGPSMPKGGSCYFVKETALGVYEAYDPRTAPLVSEQTPVKAWFATHWEVVRQVFAVPTPWYKSLSVWIAAVTGVLAFIVVMATIGG